MNRIALQLGTNQGNRIEELRKAQKKLEQKLHLVSMSSMYETAAWGMTEQNDFLNQVGIYSTDLSPFALLKYCQSIENEMGRTRDLHWGPRIIDIDIIYYSNKIIFSPELQIPHAWLQKRRFVLEPLVEVDRSWLHPLLGLSSEQLLENCDDNSEVKRIQG